MHNTSSLLYKKTTMWQWTGKEKSLQESTSSGTTTSALADFQWMDTLQRVLQKYNHPTPCRVQHLPHAYCKIIYGATHQLISDDDTSEHLDEKCVKHIQGIIGSLLYYVHAVDNILLATLSTISSQQATATVNTEKAVNQLLNYVATYPKCGTTYQASTMVLASHSDASFLTEPKSRSCAGAHILLTDDDPIPRNNGPVLTISQILKFVKALAAEAELAAVYTTAQEMIPLWNALEEMGWKLWLASFMTP